MNANIPNNLMMKEVLKTTGYNCPEDLNLKG